MSLIKNKDFIIEAIEQLRRRKARPDRERICGYVLRRHGVDSRSTIADLERLVDEEDVIKVEYKGNISYRNAATWSKLSVHKSRIEVELSDLNRLESTQDETDRMSFALRCAISELVCKEPDYLDTGVPVFELEQFLQTKDSDFFSRISFNVLLSREARAGTVIKLENGNYLLGSLAASYLDGSSKGSLGDFSESESEDGGRTEFTMYEECGPPPVDKSKKSPKHASGESEPEPAPEPQPEQPAEPLPEPEPEPARESSSEKEDDDPAERGIRKTSRKRAKKKVFDPSDNNLPKAKRRGRPSLTQEKATKSTTASHVSSAPSSASPTTVNGHGSHRDSKPPKETKTSTPHNSKINSFGIIPKVVCCICISPITDGRATFCRDCTKKAHVSCLIKGNRARFRPTTWQCSSCKTCQICDMTDDFGTLLVCVNCDYAYHATCHLPKVKIPHGAKDTIGKKWTCSVCSPVEAKPPTPEKPKLAVRQRTASPAVKSLPTPNISLPKIHEMEVDDGPVDESIPDASDWSSDDVFQFFSEKYPDHASVFKDQDIDGRSLLLMTRSDVINGLKLKLGPALKIYCQVKKLQLRRSDPHLFWE